MQRKYGWLPSYPDFRDSYYSFRNPDVVIPPVKYLICAPVVDQEDLGSCVFFALTSHMAATAVQNDQEPLNLSQLWAYYHYRNLKGIVEYDGGASIREALKIVATDGIPEENCWPYITTNFSTPPPPTCMTQAKANKITSYHALESLDSMIECIASGFGFICGISVYNSFESISTKRTGIVTIPSREDKFLGGHAIYVGGGYDLRKRIFKFQNSWGESWGDCGFGWIPFDYLADSRLCGDRFTIRR